MTEATATNASQSIFNAFFIIRYFNMVQLAKIIKISDKFRIFALGKQDTTYSKCYFYARNHTWNRIFIR